MFDVARLIALVWSLFVVVRARARLEATALLAVTYFFALAVSSGFTIRNDGPLEPMMALMLVLIGPTSMPGVRSRRSPA